MGLSAARYYRKRLRLSIRPDAVPVRLQRLSSWECVRLVPRDIAAGLLGDTPARRPPIDVGGADRVPLSASVQIARTDAGDLVLTAGAVFVPTIDYRLNERLVRGLA
jgi:hypothetical protein